MLWLEGTRMSKIVKVRIRQWDDMVKEFGYTDYSYHRDIINCLAW